jgi:hypothetical protein
VSALPATPLITIASLNEWLGVPGGQPMPSTAVPLLERMISMASAFATSYLQRPIAPQTFTETYNGKGNQRLTLKRGPVILVRSLTIGTTSISARAAVCQSGFFFDDSSVYVDGFWFYSGKQNISVTYDAGYQTTFATTVPTGLTLDVADLARPWNSDRGVAYATGAALTLVTGAPSTGQYQLTTDAQGNTVYTFAAGDSGASIVVTYGFTPEDVAQALIELVGERFRSRDRIGLVSKALEQQTTSFSQKDMNAGVKTMLQQYRNVVPAQ